MPSAADNGSDTGPIVKKSLWAGRAMSGTAVLFLLFDGVMKLVKPAPFVEAMTKLGYQDSATLRIGLLLLTCTILYTIPRTSVLGAILLTGYLGGATATHVRIQAALFPVLFPGIFGALVWGGLFLRDDRLRALTPLRQTSH